MVEATSATRARAVRMAVQRLRDRVHGLYSSCNQSRKESTHEHDNTAGRERAYVGRLPRRHLGKRFQDVGSGWTLYP
jgi:hypothetical protein